MRGPTRGLERRDSIAPERRHELHAVARGISARRGPNAPRLVGRLFVEHDSRGLEATNGRVDVLDIEVELDRSRLARRFSDVEGDRGVRPRVEHYERWCRGHDAAVGVRRVPLGEHRGVAGKHRHRRETRHALIVARRELMRADSRRAGSRRSGGRDTESPISRDGTPQPLSSRPRRLSLAESPEGGTHHTTRRIARRAAALSRIRNASVPPPTKAETPTRPNARSSAAA